MKRDINTLVSIGIPTNLCNITVITTKNGKLKRTKNYQHLQVPPKTKIDCIGCNRWLLHNPLWWRISTIYNLHYRVGTFYVFQIVTPRILSFMWCLHIVWWVNQRHSLQSENCGWCSTLWPPHIGCIQLYIFKRDKFLFYKGVIQFRGLQIRLSGVIPSESMLNAIINFSIQKNITDVLSLFKLVNMDIFFKPYHDSLLGPCQM